MATDVLGEIRKLKGFPEGLHWFCPRTAPDDTEKYYEEDGSIYEDPNDDVGNKRRKDAVQDAESRKVTVIDALPVFAFDGPQAVEIQSWLSVKLDEMLSSCDVCVRVYHKSRASLKHKLQALYDEEDVQAFFEKFDGINLKRIAGRLDSTKDTLLRLPADQRKISKLITSEIFGMFEVLSCDPFLRNDHMLVQHFDEPFSLVQTKKPLKLGFLLPACTEFLFSANNFRRLWAEQCWERLKGKELTKEDFDWCIKGALFRAMMRVQINNLDVQFLPMFWSGAKTIVSYLSKTLITHSLRAMDYDIAKLALEHMQVDTDAFPDMVGTLQKLLEMSPDDFWASMGSIGAPAVINAIFGSPALSRMLKAQGTDRSPSGRIPPISQLLGWVSPLIVSMKSTNMPPACRALASQLLDRCQSEKYSTITRSTTFNMGLRVLTQTMNALSEGDFKTISPASVTDALEVVGYFMPRLLEHTKGIKNTGPRPESAALSLQVVERALTLDCFVLKIEHEILKQHGQLGPERHSRTAELWQRITQAIGPDDQALASYALRGARDLVGLEKIVAKKGAELSEDATQFNASFDALCGQVGGILDRVNENFSTENMVSLFKSAHLAQGPISALLLVDPNARQSAVDLVKSMSSQVDRRDALSSMINSNYHSTMSALNDTLKLIVQRRVFTPISVVRRFSADIVNVLCDSQDGLLRSKVLSEDEAKVTWTFWERLWYMLRTIFEKTEDWGEVGYGKDLMVEFCRDTMQFAEQLFGAYHAFADSLGTPGDEDTADKLLAHPRVAVESMVKWIRLRDEYLINTIVALVTSMLGKLGDLELRVPDEALAYIQGVIDKQIKTKLTPQQLAQLSRAVDEHTGEPSTPPEDDKATVRKQGSINQWVRTGQAARDLMSERTKDMNKTVQESTKNAELYKSQLAQLAERKSKAAAASTAKRDLKRDLPAVNKVQNQADFLKKRKAAQEARDKAAAEAKAKALALRTVGAGAGLNAIGNLAKDHSGKGTGMMVDSDEYSSSEEDEEEKLNRELFGGPRRYKRDPAAANGFEFDKSKVPARAPVKIQRMVRSVKDMRARLIPNLTGLHRTILGWNYFHTGQLPPGSENQQYNKVANKFTDPMQYMRTFEPLLLLEAWQSFVNAREQSASPYPLLVVSRGNVDALIEVSTVLQHQDNKEQRVAEGDIVLMSKQRHANKEEPSCLARVHKINRKKQALEVIYRVAPSNPMISALIPKQTIFANKIQTITSLEREYGALQGLQYYDLCSYITAAEPSHLLTYSDKILEPIQNNYKLNRAQAKAVKSALDNDAFTLIQGPPGSGKTKTIVAIVGALLTHQIKETSTVVQMPMTNGGGHASDRAPAKKLLVCAPSNAAVDELVMRMKEGVRTTTGIDKKIKVVRLGRSEAINANVQDVTLEELVNAKLHGASNKGDARGDTQKLMSSHQEVSEKLRNARDEEAKGELKGAEASKLLDTISTLVKRKKELSALIDEAKDKEGRANREADLQRRRAQQMVIDEAHVICATLSGSGHEMFHNLNIEFETVIVDEAAQCVEMSVLIPLKYGCAKCVLVGDPKQLPPTVFSREAAEYQYEQSLFVRMQRNYPNEVHLLDTQYRMHPEISLFPSATFYDHRLLDGPDMAAQRVRPWHDNTLFGPYWFFDVQGQHQQAGHSLVNRTEIELASRLYERLIAGYGKKYDFKGKIGIITPYKSQLRELKTYFSGIYGPDILESIEFNTTDAFQGRESEIIIFSCVRASPTGGIGFLQDIRRMNVGLTRAKSSLWVMGNSGTLSKGEFWSKLIDDARARDRFLPESEYAASLKTGQPLRTEHKAMPAKPTIKSEVNDKSITPSAGFESDSSRRSSITVKPDPLAASVKTKSVVKRESAQNIKKESPSDTETPPHMKRKAPLFSSDEDTPMPDAPPSKAHSKTQPSHPPAAANINTDDPMASMFNVKPKHQIIRKRAVPVSAAGGGVLVKKKHKVLKREGDSAASSAAASGAEGGPQQSTRKEKGS